MVESSFMSQFGTEWTAKRIGIYRALATGFDRVAARPLLILPPLLLDVFLWFGPHLTIPSVIGMLTRELAIPINADPVLVEQMAAVRDTLVLFGDRFNLFSSLSTLPAGMPFNLIFSVFSSLLVGLPSLMAIRMPVATPFGHVLEVPLDAPYMILLTWMGIIIAGVGAGVIYNRWLIRQVDPQAQIGSVWIAWGRLLVLACIGYFSGVVVLFLTGLIASGQGIVFLGLPLLFVASVYLAFTPHAILRYRMGIWAALKQSLWFVRWNFTGAFGYIVTAFAILWVSTTRVWSLPDEQSWFNLLAIMGHAFVSATILAGGYAFFQGRRQWLLARIDEMTANVSSPRPSQPVSEDLQEDSTDQG